MDIEELFLSMERELKAEMSTFTRCHDTVNDVYQEAYLKIHKYKVNGRNFHGDKKSKSFMLKLMVRNMMLDMKRKQKSCKEVLVDTEVYRVTSDNPEELLIEKESSVDHEAINKRLSNAFKNMIPEIYMTYKLRMKGLKFKDIAYLTDAKRNTAQGRMRYAMEKIKKEFKD